MNLELKSKIKINLECIFELMGLIAETKENDKVMTNHQFSNNDITYKTIYKTNPKDKRWKNNETRELLIKSSDNRSLLITIVSHKGLFDTIAYDDDYIIIIIKYYLLNGRILYLRNIIYRNTISDLLFLPIDKFKENICIQLDNIKWMGFNNDDMWRYSINNLDISSDLFDKSFFNKEELQKIIYKIKLSYENQDKYIKEAIKYVKTLNYEQKQALRKVLERK